MNEVTADVQYHGAEHHKNKRQFLYTPTSPTLKSGVLI